MSTVSPQKSKTGTNKSSRRRSSVDDFAQKELLKHRALTKTRRRSRVGSIAHNKVSRDRLNSINHGNVSSVETHSDSLVPGHSDRRRSTLYAPKYVSMEVQYDKSQITCLCQYSVRNLYSLYHGLLKQMIFFLK